MGAHKQSIAETEPANNATIKLIINLTPLIPLSFEGEGEGLVLKGRSPFNLPLINDL